MTRAALFALVLALGSALAGCRHGPSTTSVPAALDACPKSPNCVSSTAKNSKHAIAPLTFTKDADAAWAELRAAVVALPRATIVKEADGYLHAECRSPKMGYVDDLQLLLDRDAKVVHVRSAARNGLRDFGVNRARVEELRKGLGW